MKCKSAERVHKMIGYHLTMGSPLEDGPLNDLIRDLKILDTKESRLLITDIEYFL
jgi:hypothetical protein